MIWLIFVLSCWTVYMLPRLMFLKREVEYYRQLYNDLRCQTDNFPKQQVKELGQQLIETNKPPKAVSDYTRHWARNMMLNATFALSPLSNNGFKDPSIKITSLDGGSNLKMTVEAFYNDEFVRNERMTSRSEVVDDEVSWNIGDVQDEFFDMLNNQQPVKVERPPVKYGKEGLPNIYREFCQECGAEATGKRCASYGKLVCRKCYYKPLVKGV